MIQGLVLSRVKLLPRTFPASLPIKPTGISRPVCWSHGETKSCVCWESVNESKYLRAWENRWGRQMSDRSVSEITRLGVSQLP